MTEREDKILKAILEIETRGATIEEIVEKTGIDKQRALFVISLLEIKGRIHMVNIPLDGCYLELYCLTEGEYQDQIQVYLWDFFSSGLREQKV